MHFQGDMVNFLLENMALKSESIKKLIIIIDVKNKKSYKWIEYVLLNWKKNFYSEYISNYICVLVCALSAAKGLSDRITNLI